MANSAAESQPAATRTGARRRVGLHRVDRRSADRHRADRHRADRHRVVHGSGAPTAVAAQAGPRPAVSATRPAASNWANSRVAAASRSPARPADRSRLREWATAYPRLVRTARPKRRQREACPAHAAARTRRRRVARPAGSHRRAADLRSRPRRPSNAGWLGRPDPCTSRARFRSLVAFRRAVGCSAIKRTGCGLAHRCRAGAANVRRLDTVLNTVVRPGLDSSVTIYAPAARALPAGALGGARRPAPPAAGLRRAARNAVRRRVRRPSVRGCRAAPAHVRSLRTTP